MSTERIIVQRGVSERLIALVKKLMADIKAGDHNEFPKYQVTALFAKGSADNIVRMIKEAQTEGAQVILGDLKTEGAVVQPHLVASVRPGMNLWENETFGPGQFPDLSLSFDSASIDDAFSICHSRRNCHRRHSRRSSQSRESD